MDPTANLDAIRAIVDRMQRHDSYSEPYDTHRLCELIEALDGWITRGGFLPHYWQTESEGK